MIDSNQTDYSCFTGADIVAYINGEKVSVLQGMTISIIREIFPEYEEGWTDPVAFTKGPRVITGNLVFSGFKRKEILTHSPFDVTITTKEGDKIHLKEVQLVSEGHGYPISEDILNKEYGWSFVAKSIAKG
jgi:hypothetical protein